jgi:hypothetical protein
MIFEDADNCGFPPSLLRASFLDNKKPSKEAGKGTFEGQVVAGTRLELVTFGL